MNRKMIGVLILVFVIGASDIVSAAPSTDVPQNLSPQDMNNYLAMNFDGNEANISFWTYGPLRFVSRVTFINGSQVDLLAARYILRKNILPRLRLVTYMVVSNRSTIDFTVEYRRSLPLGFVAPFFYMTAFGNMGDGNLNDQTDFMCASHTVRVEGFSGVIGVFRRFLFTPERFFIAGTCQNVTVLSSS